MCIRDSPCAISLRVKQELGIMYAPNSMFPPDCFSKTDASFIVGEMHQRIAGCNTLASLHFPPDHFHMWNESLSYTYVSHSIKEFFSNLQKLPEDLNNASAYHLCVDTKMQWNATHNNRSAVFDPSSDLFQPKHGSGIDALVKEIFKNESDCPFRRDPAYMYLGSYITEGYFGCPEVRFDWEQDGQMHNLSRVAGTSGTEKTKQWLNISKIDGITKLSMVGTISKVYGQTSRFPPDQIAGATCLSRSLSLQVLFTLFVASLIVSCA